MLQPQNAEPKNVQTPTIAQSPNLNTQYLIPLNPQALDPYPSANNLQVRELERRLGDVSADNVDGIVAVAHNEGPCPCSKFTALHPHPSIHPMLDCCDLPCNIFLHGTFSDLINVVGFVLKGSERAKAHRDSTNPFFKAAMWKLKAISHYSFIPPKFQAKTVIKTRERRGPKSKG